LKKIYGGKFTALLRVPVHLLWVNPAMRTKQPFLRRSSKAPAFLPLQRLPGAYAWGLG
jgi:hypothetical protein